MKEKYLHAIWRTSRIPQTNLKLTNGKSLTVLKAGIQNLDAGPDFFNGSILIDGINWNGNIEIHINSSDWYKHKHQNDIAYNTVILHVVFNHDEEIYCQGEKLPCLELKNYFDSAYFEKFGQLIDNKNWIACENSLAEIPTHIITNQIENSLFDRLNRKANLLSDAMKNNLTNKMQVIYELYAACFGLKVNTLPFIELTKQLDLKILWKENEYNGLCIVFGVAGFFKHHERFKLTQDLVNWNYLQKKYNLNTMNFETWKFKGIRPTSFPNLKLKEFYKIVSNQNFFKVYLLEKKELIFWIESLKMSKFMQRNILINAVVPILWQNWQEKDSFEQQEKSFEILNELKAEENSIISKFKNLGIQINSSFESQGLLELKNELCANKKCLDCKVGSAILNQ